MTSSESIGIMRVKKNAYSALINDNIDLENELINTKAENYMLNLQLNHLIGKNKETSNSKNVLSNKESEINKPMKSKEKKNLENFNFIADIIDVYELQKNNLKNENKEVQKQSVNDNSYEENDSDSEYDIKYISESEPKINKSKYKWEPRKIYLPWDKKWIYPKNDTKYESMTINTIYQERTESY